MMRKKPTNVVKRSGTTKSMPLPFYPKRYSVKVTKNEDGNCVITRKAENFSAWELYGMLKLLLLEIERQMRIQPEDELKVE